MKLVSIARALIVALLGASAGAFAAAETIPPYRDPAQPREVRIRDLISRMTLEEKASMMGNTTPGVPRLGIPKYDWWSEALHGVANAGQATVFPQAIGLAAMWDPELHQRIAHTIGIEGRAKFNGYVGTPQEGTIFHGLTFWSPNINIFRDPRWGRGQETYGEDPFLTAQLGVAFVRGLQGDDREHLLAAACAKHFAVHSGPESLRHGFDVSPSEADLYETYLPAFEALVREAKVEIVMTAYNSLYGKPCSINPLLYGLLDRWGFAGHITSDCGSVGDLRHSYQLAKSDAEAETLTVRAGMNVCCGGEAPGLINAVHDKLLAESEVDQRLAPLLRTMFRLGFFDPKESVPFNRIAPAENDTPAHGALALQAAREAMVLLKNDGLLPLQREKLRRVAVIGPNASSVSVLAGNYNGTPSAPVSVLAGLKAALEPAGVKVEYAHGCDYAARPAGVRLVASNWYQGHYFANPRLEGEPVVTRTERPLSFDFGSPPRGGATLPDNVPARGISVRWTGDLQTTLAGDYHLVVRGRGGFRLRIGGATVVDSWTPPAGEAGKDREVAVVHRLPDNATLPLELEYAQGDGPVKVALEWSSPPADSDFDAALQVAKTADVIVFVGGISALLEGEEMQVDYEGYAGGDRLAIELPAVQQELLGKLRAIGKPIVFVNLSGSAIAMPAIDGHANAILQAWYPGQAGGTAVADVLLGQYNPAGRLPLTFYRATADLTDFKNYDMAGRTYRYFRGKPMYAFGHGLSYTTFQYANLRLAPAPHGGLVAKVNVTNTGKRAGEEVVQVYATPPSASHPREVRALCGFQRLALASGETKTVDVTVPATALRRWDAARHEYVTPSGDWTFAAGASSEDLRQTTTFAR
jgi:beta-glucosidase